MSADISLVAADELPDVDQLGAELVGLKHRQEDLLRLHDRLTEQLLAFPNDFRRAQAGRVAAQINEMSERIEWLEGQLLPLRHDP